MTSLYWLANTQISLLQCHGQTAQHEKAGWNMIRQYHNRLRNPFFLDSESGFDWTVNPKFTGQFFLQFLLP
jgi:hypothetical protein